ALTGNRAPPVVCPGVGLQYCYGVGGGAYACTLNNCTVSGNGAWGDGGVYGCILTNCALSGNSGPGAEESVLNNCRLTGNSEGGAFRCTLNNCMISGNGARGDGGADGLGYGRTPPHCTVARNRGSTAP